jgi:hypothetical protein
MRCDICKTTEFVDRLTEMCEKDPHTYSEMRNIAEYFETHSEISPLSGDAVKHLMREKDPEVEAKALKTLGSQCEHGNVATAKQVKIVLSNIRARVPTKGGDHMGALKLQEGAEVLSNALEFYKSHFLQGEEPNDLEVEKYYYTGDTPEIPETPDTQEPKETPKAVVFVPQDVIDIEARMEEERISREARELQRKKNEEEDQREMNVIEEKNKNTRTRDELAEEITLAMKKAVVKGIPTVYISDAIDMAFDNVFPGWKELREDTKSRVSGAAKNGGLFK